MPFGGAIVNKVHYEGKLAGNRAKLERLLTENLSGDEGLAAKIVANFDDFAELSARDRRNVKQLIAEVGSDAVIEVPYLDSDVHDLAGLMEINRYLFASGAKERDRIAASA